MFCTNGFSIAENRYELFSNRVFNLKHYQSVFTEAHKHRLIDIVKSD